MGTSDKLLTISIPTWNRAKLIKELLESLVGQIHKDNLADYVEIVVSNNASEDNTHEIIEDFKSKNPFITYNKNSVNIGSNPNVMKSMAMASAEYLILLGDDDRINDGSLKRVIEFLQANKDTGVVIDSGNFRKSYAGKEITLTGLLRKYYWDMGNAGVFIMKSFFVKDSLNKYGAAFFNENWSQTQFMILGLNDNKNLKAYISDLKIISHSLHKDMTIYNSFYLWRGGYYELFIAIKALENIVDKETLKPAYEYLKDNIFQFALFNVLQFGVFIDEKDIRIKTRDHVRKYLKLFSLYEKVFLWIIIIALSVPNSLARFISRIFIFIAKGKKGYIRTNEFIKNEINKNKEAKKQKSIAVRKLEYEIDKY